jgi:hypothetical protein
VIFDLIKIDSMALKLAVFLGLLALAVSDQSHGAVNVKGIGKNADRTGPKCLFVRS